MARNLRSNGNRGDNIGGMIDGEALKRSVDRVVALMEERKELNDDIKKVYEEAKDAGFVTKHLRQLVREAMMDPEVLEDHLSQMDALRHALGQFANEPLGKAAMEQASRATRQRRSAAQEAIDRAVAHLEGEPPEEPPPEAA